MTTVETHALTINSGDVALILKEDGHLEISLPEDADASASNVFTAAALIHALGDPELCETLMQAFAESCNASTETEAAPKPTLHAIK